MKKIFIVTPFEEKLIGLYEFLKNYFKDKYKFERANDKGSSVNILKDIITKISEADYVLVDLTGLKPNIMYELGIAQGFNKNTILITGDDISNLPFDIK